MAGRNSPWGGGKGNGDSGDNGDDDTSGESGDHPGDGPSDSKGPRNPWLPSGETPPRRSASIEDIFRGREQRRSGGGGPRGPGGGFPNLPRRPDGKSWLPLGMGLAVAVLLGLSMFHTIGPKEQAIVTRFGQYSRSIDSGISFTLPWPVEHVDVEDVRSFRVDMIPDNDNEKLMLTSDKNLVDLSYLVRWNIKNLKNFKFRLADPDETVREVAEAAMRASIAQISLNDAISGAGRAQVEQDVRERMQRILDYYKSGVAVQGVEIKKADPPAKTKAAFEQVTVAQQEAERDRSEARAWAQQKLAEAQGNASAFNKVYEEYRLAPEVTKRRMYYETMEGVVRDTNTVVAEGDNVTPYLPLSEIRRHANNDMSDGSTTVTAKGGQ
ncbi:protease modulator HflK [Novosphingobium malaysiense]|uniref:Peptidase n=1 Tax=Novosphingobium malaysiense TaxID=1348853 RepID=A0A0B1ZMW5_9SPHN|nr:protease modulator HflK [Novosphingobium malaysiense]KHK92495.1 peptidase [Novosphingobium malaysiense]